MDRRDRVRLRRAALVGATLGPITAVTLAANADTTSGQWNEKPGITLNDGSHVDGCAESGLVTSTHVSWATNWIHAWDGGSCASDYKTGASGYLGVTNWMYRDGYNCNVQSGTNNGSVYAGYSLGITCSDPAGSQQWQALAQAYWYKGSHCHPGECYLGYAVAPDRVPSPYASW
jgi:hypothetical protein